jgi:hypothetical protein
VGWWLSVRLRQMNWWWRRQPGGAGGSLGRGLVIWSNERLLINKYFENEIVLFFFKRPPVTLRD